MRYSGWALVVSVILLPVQIAISPDFLNFSPSDLFLALHLLLGIRTLRIVRRAWSVWHVAALGAFIFSTAVVVLRTGRLSEYVLVRKDLGIVVLYSYYLAITSYCRSWERTKSLVRSFVSAVVLFNALALVEWVLCRVSPFDLARLNHDSNRLSGLFDDPNAYGSMLVVALCFQIAAEISGHSLFPGYTRLFVTGTLIMSVALTFSRSAWLGCLPIMAFLILARPSLVVKAGVVVCVSMGVLVLFLGGEFASFAVSMSLRSLGARLELIRLAFNLFTVSPIVGMGLGYVKDSGYQIIHNTILWIMAEFGLVGLFSVGGLLLWVFILGVKTARNVRREQRGLVVGAILGHLAMFCVSLGIEALYQRWWWYAMAVAVSRPVENSSTLAG